MDRNQFHEGLKERLKNVGVYHANHFTIPDGLDANDVLENQTILIGLNDTDNEQSYKELSKSVCRYILSTIEWDKHRAIQVFFTVTKFELENNIITVSFDFKQNSLDYINN